MKNEWLLFIDDSGKLYDKNNFTIYNCIVFSSLKDYSDFCSKFWLILKNIYDGEELKGSKFWTKAISIKNKSLLLNIINNYKNVYIFSIVLNKKELYKKYKNDIECEKLLNQSIAMLCDDICKKLQIKNSNLNLFIDEQVRTYDIEDFLNNDKSNFLSLRRLREKNITFKVDPNVKSHESPGVMFSDIIANGINRIKNKNAFPIEKIIEKSTSLKITYFIWPYKNYIQEKDKEYKEIWQEKEEELSI